MIPKNAKEIKLPASSAALASLSAGEIVLLSGAAYTARDAAHKRIADALAADKKPPFDLTNAAIYYAGPSPARAGEIIGSCGPTSSARMDAYTPLLLEQGLKVMIGKGRRSEDVRRAIAKSGAVYLLAVGGAAVLIKSYVTGFEPTAYPELLSEAVCKITFDKLPLIVGIDSQGNSVFS